MANHHSVSELQSYRDNIINIILEAEGVFDFGSTNYNVYSKEKQDFVTELDLSIEKFIVSKIKLFDSHSSFLCEEAGKDDQMADSYWIIDPLDGTGNFIRSLPIFSISIAYYENSECVMSLVYDLDRKETFDAIKGGGARVNGKSINVPESTSEQSQCLIGLSSGVIDRYLTKDSEFLSGLRELGKIRILGSQALQLCYVACGRLNATFSVEAKIWDDAAGRLMVEEAQGFYLSDENTAFGSSLFSCAYGQNIKQELEPLISQYWKK